MKKFFLALLMSVMMISCSKDENNSIEGTWGIESVTYTVNGKEVTRESEYCEAKSSVTLSEGKLTSISYDSDAKGKCQESDREEGSYTISGNKITVKYKNGEEEISEFSVSGDTLTIIRKGNKVVFKRK